MGKFRQLVPVGISVGILAGIWTEVSIAIGLLTFVGFLSWASYYAAGAGHSGLLTTVPANIAGTIIGFLIVKLSDFWSIPFALGFAVLIGAFVMCVEAGWSVVGFIPGAFIGCSSYFGAAFDFWGTVIALVAGAVLGWASFWGGELLGRYINPVRAEAAPVGDALAG